MHPAGTLLLLLLLSVAVHSATALYSPKDGVVLATDATFNALVLQSNRPSIVEFFAPWCGHCKNLAPEYKKLAGATKGMVNVVAVDCDDSANKPLCGRQGVKGFPTIKLFTPGQKSPEDYTGARSAKPMLDAVLAKLHGRNIKKLTASNADAFLSDGSLPKVILFTSKDKPGHAYLALSMEYQHSLDFAHARDHETALVERFGVKEFPALVVVKNDDENTVVRYDGGFGYLAIDSFLATFAPKAKGSAKKGTSKQGSEEKADSTPTPLAQKLYALESEEDFKKYCSEQRRICAIGFVPSKEIDEEEHNKAVQTLEALASAREPGDAFLVMWADGVKAAEFSRRLDLAVDLPTFAVLSAKKKGYAAFRGAFTPSALGDFLDGIKSGAKKTFSLGDNFPTKLYA
jgi:protein disulfide-isomerase A6